MDLIVQSMLLKYGVFVACLFCVYFIQLTGLRNYWSSSKVRINLAAICNAYWPVFNKSCSSCKYRQCGRLTYMQCGKCNLMFCLYQEKKIVSGAAIHEIICAAFTMRFSV